MPAIRTRRAQGRGRTHAPVPEERAQPVRKHVEAKLHGEAAQRHKREGAAPASVGEMSVHYMLERAILLAYGACAGLLAQVHSEKHWLIKDEDEHVHLE